LLKIKEATIFIVQNFLLVSAIIITVWAPLEIIFEWISSYYPRHRNILDISVKSVFHYLSNGAILHVLFSVKHGREINYSTAISAGFKDWGRLVNAGVQEGLYISLGLIALVIPGVMLAIDYSFGESLVIHRGMGTKSMSKSRELIKTRRWKIFSTQLATWLLILFIASISLAVQSSMGLMNNYIANVVITCIFDLIAVICPIVTALLYLEARTEQVSAQQWET
jgi:hypothetical protein